MMISPKKLMKIARNWPKLAALNGRKISFPSITSYEGCTTTTSSSFVVEKGHFVVYTTDEKRFVMPLAYLNDNILRELFKMSEQEFGLSSRGPITLPCDAVFMEYVVNLIRRGVAKDLEMALIRSMNTTGCSFISSSNFHEERFATQQVC
ncbi:auxin-responsive protein SAUR68-like [Humulus lupulus]|uniref:auxin-responsive protein SAUR68-like n=1 Tax=Humulus lupulus TaxID=3486 RepID=UPI002B4009D7|nr:auxin-responsive protein SAUR68-like [Humulus lupulus]